MTRLLLIAAMALMIIIKSTFNFPIRYSLFLPLLGFHLMNQIRFQHSLLKSLAAFHDFTLEIFLDH